LAGAHASKIGLERAGELIGLLHDLGKYSLAFQNYLKSAEGLIDPDGDDYVDAKALKGKIDHSTAGAQFIWNRLSALPKFGPYVAQMLGLCIASHHSGLIDCISAGEAKFGEDLFTHRMNKVQAKTHLDEVVQAADSAVLTRAAELINEESLLKSVELLGQSIFQANAKRPIGVKQHLGLMVRFLFSCLIDADRTNTGDFEHGRVKSLRQCGIYADWVVLAARLEAYLGRLKSDRPIDGLRRDISRHCFDAATRSAGTFTLTVPTGGGKTLASLRFALHHAQQRKLDRIIYVIPFTSIIDQNAGVVRTILENNAEESGKIVLEHHSNLTPEHQSWREKILCENWDAPVVYTTMVQLLEALFGAGTRGARRMHQLANSVLIFDEVQSLPIKCVHLFNNAVNFLVEQCNSTVVLCTATQPLLHEVSQEKGAIRLSPNHEIMPDTQKLFDELKRVDVRDCRRPGGWTYEAVAGLAMGELKKAGSCLVVVNTKDAARRVYQLCAGVEDAERVHLSTDMCPAHRKEKLASVCERLQRGLPVLCVSTQLIEAGVDVDFGVAIRFMAGLDSIAQTAGRCNRNGRPQPGLVYIINAAEENLGNLADIEKAGDIAKRVLNDYRDRPERYRHNLLGPEALKDYYSYYFFGRKEDMSYKVSVKEIGHDDTLLNMLSENSQATADYRRNRNASPPIHFVQAFMTAANVFKSIDGATQGVIVPFGEEGRRLIAELCAAYEVELQYKLLKRAQQFTVNVFQHVLDKLSRAGAIHRIKEDVDILHLDERYYSNDYGLSTEPIAMMRMCNV
jgi:CRISPR-associated endonuclease/helicase Cas3